MIYHYPPRPVEEPARAIAKELTNAVVEGYVATALGPERRAAEQRARGADARADAIAARGDEIPREQRARIMRQQEELIEGGVPVEAYRHTGLEEALARLV